MEELHHWHGTGNPKYVEVNKRSRAKTYTNNFWLAVQDMYAELIAQGATPNVVKHFIRQELKINLGLCDKMYNEGYDDALKKVIENKKI